MSFDLLILEIEENISLKEIYEVYKKLCDGDYDAVKPNTNINYFIDETNEIYPSIDECAEDQLETCPWTVEHFITEGAIILSIRWSVAEEMLYFIKDLAQKYHLSCYDPQENKIYYPAKAGTKINKGGKNTKYTKSNSITYYIEKAKAGEINPGEFAAILFQKRKDSKQAMFYLHEIFNIPLGEAKRIILETYYSSNSKWYSDMNMELDKAINSSEEKCE